MKCYYRYTHIPELSCACCKQIIARCYVVVVQARALLLRRKWDKAQVMNLSNLHTMLIDKKNWNTPYYIHSVITYACAVRTLYGVNPVIYTQFESLHLRTLTYDLWPARRKSLVYLGTWRADGDDVKDDVVVDIVTATTTVPSTISAHKHAGICHNVSRLRSKYNCFWSTSVASITAFGARAYKTGNPNAKRTNLEYSSCVFQQVNLPWQITKCMYLGREVRPTDVDKHKRSWDKIGAQLKYP